MRTLLLVALGAAVLLGAVSGPEPFMPRLVRLEAAAALPEMAARIPDEPVAVAAVLLEYAPDPDLRFGAALALHRYPELARRILPVYGAEPEFREVLARHGPAVMPPIAYFMDHEIRSLQVMRAAGEALDGARRAALRVLDGGTGPAATQTVPVAGDIPPVERGWYAIAFIRDEGHDFLGQFEVDREGGVHWVQTERLAEAATAFFTSGVRTLETRYRLDEEPGAADWLWAGVDVALVAGAAKLLRAGRAAGTGVRAAAVPARASLGARTVMRAGRTALRVGRYGVPVAVAWAVVRHPSLVSGIAAQVAAFMGWPAPVVQGAVWFLVLLPVLVLARLLLRWVVRPLLAAAGLVARGVAAPEPRKPRRDAAADRELPERVTPRLGDLPRLGEP